MEREFGEECECGSAGSKSTPQKQQQRQKEVVVDGRHLQLPLKSKIGYYLKTYSTASLSFDAEPLLDEKSNANKCSNCYYQFLQIQIILNTIIKSITQTKLRKWFIIIILSNY